LGASLLNVHLDAAQGVATYVAAIEPLVKVTANAGLQLAIENTVFTGPEDFNELFDRLRGLRRVPTTHVGMCLDIGHANLYAGTRNDYLGFVSRLAPTVPILHLHLHENWGDADTHLPLFTGPAALDATGLFQLCAQLRRRGYGGSIILEQWPQPPDLLSYARDRLQAILASDPTPVLR
jgi:sugar phosphate isomerase/epimerase